MLLRIVIICQVEHEYMYIQMVLEKNIYQIIGSNLIGGGHYADALFHIFYILVLFKF